MNWMARDTNNRRDPKILRLYRRYGSDGRDLYWTILDLIAEKITDNNLSFTLEETSDDLAIEMAGGPTVWTPEKVDAILNYCIELNLFDRVVTPQGLGSVRCLKLMTRLNTNMSRNPTIRRWIETAKNFEQCSKSVQTKFELGLDINQSIDQQTNLPTYLQSLVPLLSNSSECLLKIADLKEKLKNPFLAGSNALGQQFREQLVFLEKGSENNYQNNFKVG